MVVTYEDVSGNVSTTEKEFELEVLPMAADDMPADAAPVEQKASIPVIPIVIGVLVVAGVVLTIVLLRRKKKKQMLAEEEDLADEVDRLTEDE